MAEVTHEQDVAKPRAFNETNLITSNNLNSKRIDLDATESPLILPRFRNVSGLSRLTFRRSGPVKKIIHYGNACGETTKAG